MDYVLRLQALDGYHAKFDEVFGDRFSRVLCVHHLGKKRDNPHYHFCLTTDYKSDALRKYLKGHFSLAKGNKHLSLKSWDGNPKACSYLFHEGTEPIIARGFTPGQLTEFQETNDLIQSKMVKPNMIVDKCIEHFNELRGNRVLWIPGKREIFYKIMALYRHNGEWLPNKFQAERLINKVRSDFIDDKAEHSLWNIMYNEYFPYD